MRLKSVKKPLFIISSLGSLFLSLLMTEGYQTMGALGALLGYSLGAVQEVGPLLAGKGGKRAPKQPSTLRPKLAQKWETIKSYSTGEQIFKEVYSNPIEMHKGKGWTEASIVVPGNSKSSSINAQKNLNKKLRALERAQIKAVKTVTLPDGRIRYYGKGRLAEKKGNTSGAALVTEYNPKTGQVRVWNECYNQSGQVNRVHPKMVDGQQLDSQHYPLTKTEL